MWNGRHWRSPSCWSLGPTPPLRLGSGRSCPEWSRPASWSRALLQLRLESERGCRPCEELLASTCKIRRSLPRPAQRPAAWWTRRRSCCRCSCCPAGIQSGSSGWRPQTKLSFPVLLAPENLCWSGALYLTPPSDPPIPSSYSTLVLHPSKMAFFCARCTLNENPRWSTVFMKMLWMISCSSRVGGTWKYIAKKKLMESLVI